MKQMSVAIIGTAGRNVSLQDTPYLSKELFENMVKEAHRIITEEFKLDTKEVVLVSGGASWSDHVSVSLFLDNQYEYNSLKIHLPCDWDFKNHQHKDTGEYDWKKNAGKSANKYHISFSKEMNKDTLLELESITKKDGGEFIIGKGFHDRNNKVAKSDYMIAFTFDESENMISGGTGYTWNKSKSKNKKHINLSQLI